MSFTATKAVKEVVLYGDQLHPFAICGGQVVNDYIYIEVCKYPTVKSNPASCYLLLWDSDHWTFITMLINLLKVRFGIKEFSPSLFSLGCLLLQMWECRQAWDVGGQMDDLSQKIKYKSINNLLNFGQYLHLNLFFKAFPSLSLPVSSSKHSLMLTILLKATQ